ncbi:biliverdin-producing heme oxygenase [Lysobacter sp. FW306-1B-D06B]|uniref:biliverdin-producing heme oxygenase n=1 Tax=Lysobacter sp. FW306-1B-D06B TaxID=3140250 RepID=UPI0031405B59
MSLGTLRSHLRQATAPAHERVDALLPHGVGRRDDYAAYLRAMHRFVASACLPEGTRERYLPLLRADLHALGIDPDAIARPAVASHDPYERLGWAYVFEGSSLGARMLLRQAQGLGFNAASGARYLHEHAASPQWPALLAQLESSAPDADALHRLVVASNTAFAAVEAALLHALRLERVPA